MPKQPPTSYTAEKAIKLMMQMAGRAGAESSAISEKCAFTLMAIDADGNISACDWTAPKDVEPAELMRNYLQPAVYKLCETLKRRELQDRPSLPSDELSGKIDRLVADIYRSPSEKRRSS